MPCGCRKNRPVNGIGEVVGYEYISPDGISSLAANGQLLLTLAEARVEQRVHGGGTIKTHRRKAPPN
jgi:hypothetical protein